MGLKDKLREFLDTVGDDDIDDPGEAGIREGDAPTDEADQVEEVADGGAADEGIDEDVDESGDGDDTDEDADSIEDDGLQDSAETVASLRASLIKLGTENERLRTRLAELGGDAALTTDLEVEDEVEEDEPDEQTDEEAQADIDSQLEQIEALRGTK
jgi:hypothetical protein